MSGYAAALSYRENNFDVSGVLGWRPELGRTARSGSSCGGAIPSRENGGVTP